MTFFRKTCELSISLKPANASDQGYDARSLKALKSKLDAIPANIHKFKILCREVSAFRPTGTNLEQNRSMTISSYLRKKIFATCESKDLP